MVLSAGVLVLVLIFSAGISKDVNVNTGVSISPGMPVLGLVSKLY